MKTYILCSAIHIDDNSPYVHQPKNIKTGFVVCGRRHHNCMVTMSLIFDDINNLELKRLKKDGKIIQGFLTNTDKFVDREDAFKIAKQAKQFENIIGNLLTSEDLW